MQRRGAQRKSVPAFAIFQVSTAQNDQYIQPAYFEVVYSAILYCLKCLIYYSSGKLKLKFIY